MSDPVICPETGVPALASYARYHCRCPVCISEGAEHYAASPESEPDPEAQAEAEKERLQREKLSEEIMEATKTTYEGGGRSVQGGHVPEAAVEDVQGIVEGDDG